MDSTTTSNMSDDQELAKVLESMNQQAGSVPPVPPLPPVEETDTPQVTTDDGLSFEETPSEPASTDTPSEELVTTEESTPSELAVEPLVASPPEESSPELDSIKKTALEELRPLVDKLDLPADEKFDTLLLLIRSTDDKTLVSAAHEAARNISDETKRAQALLDVIKEIDYFSGHGQNPA